MGLYLYIGSYTREGRAGLISEGGTSREKETRGLFEKLGARVHHYAFAVGEFDFIILAECPDDTVALVPPLLASATGTVSVRTVKLVAPAQMDEIAAQTKAFAFRGAGH
jgi:uncharacterized protein with GYD domain